MPKVPGYPGRSPKSKQRFMPKKGLPKGQPGLPVKGPRDPGKPVRRSKKP